jgi:hypothetical protein
MGHPRLTQTGLDYVEYEEPVERAPVLGSETSCVGSVHSLDETATRRHPITSPESAINISLENRTDSCPYTHSHSLCERQLVPLGCQFSPPRARAVTIPLTSI